MTLVDTRERMMALAPVTEAVHRWGGRIFIQIGNAGIYAMEGWHSEYAKTRTRPLVAVSKPRVHVRPALIGTPITVMTTQRRPRLRRAVRTERRLGARGRIRRRPARVRATRS